MRDHLSNGTGFVAFKYQEYRFFWLAAAFSNIGMWALIYGRLWLMHQLTNSPFMVGLTTTSSLLPVLLFSIWGGVIADRVNRLKLVRVTRLMFAIVAVATGFLITIEVIVPWHIIALSVCTGVLLSIDIPSRAAMLPSIVPKEHLASAIALYSLVFGAAAILGPVVFAPLVQFLGIQGIFFVIGMLYLLTVATLMFMKTDLHRPINSPSSMVLGMLGGLAYLRSNHPIQAVVLMGIVMGVFGHSFETLLPSLADQVIEGGVRTYSRLLLSAGIGGLLATFLIALFGVSTHHVRVYSASGILLGLSLILLSRMDVLAGASLSLGLIGVCRVTFQTMGTTLLQHLSADEFRGRMMSIDQFTWGSSALGGLLMGVIGEKLGIESAFMIAGVLVVSTVVAVSWLMLRRLLVTGISILNSGEVKY